MMNLQSSRPWLPRLRRAAILSLSLSLPATAVQADLSEGWLSYWPLESKDTGIAEDVIYSNDMAIIGDPVVSPGVEGNAFGFDGASTYLSISHPFDNDATGLPIYNSGSYSIAMWVKGVPQTTSYLYTEASTVSNNPLLLIQTGTAAGNNMKLDILIRPDIGPTPVNHRVSTTTVFDDTWHHIVWVDDFGDAKLYVDGVLDATDFSYTRIGTFNMDTSTIGTLVRATVATADIFNGQIDEFAVWERALTPEDVSELFNNGLPENPPDDAPTFRTALTDVEENLGGWHTFRADVAGVRPYTFQWFRNGEAIEGATGPTYQTSALTMDDSGDTFSVKVTNAFGELTSEEVTLTVNDDPAPNLTDGLVNYWPLDTVDVEGDLRISPDLASGNDLVLINFIGDSFETPPGQFGNALFFDPVLSMYGFRTNGAPIALHTNYSISMWVQAPFEAQNDRRVYTEASTSDGSVIAFGTDAAGADASMRVYLISSDGVPAPFTSAKSTRPVFDNTWHHVVWTDENGDGKLYIDGVLDETDFSYDRTARTLHQTAIGAVLRANPASFFYGAIDEVATWNRALTWSEVQELMTEGVPEPTETVPPVILTQPAEIVGDIFRGASVQFTVQNVGTLPLTYQWYRNGAALDTTANPTAATGTLVLNNVQGDDSGSYHVVITNPAGSDQSAAVDLDVISSLQILAVDVGPDTNLQPGFSPFTLGTNPSTYDGITLTVSGPNLAERLRTQVANNPPDFTLAQVYNDFIFNNSTTDGVGLEILVEGLTPNTPYGVTIWSFDPVSTGVRSSDWTEISGETPVIIQTGYTFNGSVHPTTDLGQALQTVLTSSDTGTLRIQSLKMGGTQLGAFFNGIRIVDNPQVDGTVEIVSTAMVDGKVRITVESTGDQNVAIEQNDDLGDGTWEPATGGTVVSSVDGTTIIEFTPSAPHMFYRAVLSE